MPYHLSTLGGLAALLLFLSGFLGKTPAEVNSVRGQTLYVPVYSEIPYGDRDQTLDLTVTLSIRNIDRKIAVMLRKVDYYNTKGELVRAYAQEPRVLPPLATVEFVIKASDRSGGISAGFLVEWESEHLCVPPVVEAVMISTASTQGISFSSQARVVEEKR
jgi:Protein of unknown function (DUF3124)